VVEAAGAGFAQFVKEIGVFVEPAVEGAHANAGLARGGGYRGRFEQGQQGALLIGLPIFAFWIGFGFVRGGGLPALLRVRFGRHGLAGFGSFWQDLAGFSQGDSPGAGLISFSPTALLPGLARRRDLFGSISCLTMIIPDLPGWFLPAAP
jgi:hypothetical protein